MKPKFIPVEESFNICKKMPKISHFSAHISPKCHVLLSN